MSTRLIVPPVGLAVSMEAARMSARADLREDGTSALDAEIEQAIRTYTTEAEGEMSRAVIQQVWRVTLDCFPAAPRGGPGAIPLSKSPLLQVEHVKFYDIEGVQRLLDPQDYEADGESEPGFIVPAPSRAWPATAHRINAVEAQYRCGYGADYTAVPDGIKGFILARVAEHFETGGRPTNEKVLRLLWPYKVYNL